MTTDIHPWYPAAWADYVFEEREFMYTLSEQQMKALENNFTYHAPKGDQPAKYEMLRNQAKSLAAQFNLQCPPSRELSLAMTKLEEAMFWANASIARNE